MEADMGGLSLRWGIAVLILASAAGCTLSGRGPGRASGSAENGEPTSARATDEPSVEIHAVRYADLDSTIRQFRGKVVVVDFWMFNCPPCKAGFPYLVQLHDKYGSHGLVVISVNMDAPTKSELREQALTFLKQKHARFTNLVLAGGEDPMEWVKMRDDPATGGTGFEGDLPFTEVYDRMGNLALHQVDVNHDDLDKLVQELLLKR
jgi:thiol-disulfide isomerase/thioredoxin